MEITFYQEFKANKGFWKKLEKSLLDSKKSSVWPNHLSTIKSEKIGKNALIRVTYKFLFFKFHAEYEIVDYKKKQSISLRAHP